MSSEINVKLSDPAGYAHTCEIICRLSKTQVACHREGHEPVLSLSFDVERQTAQERVQLELTEMWCDDNLQSHRQKLSLSEPGKAQIWVSEAKRCCVHLALNVKCESGEEKRLFLHDLFIQGPCSVTVPTGGTIYCWDLIVISTFTVLPAAHSA